MNQAPRVAWLIGEENVLHNMTHLGTKLTFGSCVEAASEGRGEPARGEHGDALVLLHHSYDNLQIRSILSFLQSIFSTAPLFGQFTNITCPQFLIIEC